MSAQPATQAVVEQRLPTPAAGTVRALLQAATVRERFEQVLGERAAGFIASLANLVYASKQLKECDPPTVIAAALQAAAFDLPIDPNLGFAYIIPYGTQARFQPGWKAFVQLAHRTGQYRALHVTEIYEGELKHIHRFTGVPAFGQRTGDKVVGYMAYFELTNGFAKYLYMTAEECLAHGQKYSKTFSRTDSKWKTEFDAMARKTVLKQLLTKWGPLTTDMQKVYAADVVPEESDNGDGWVDAADQEHAPIEADVAQPAPDPETGEIKLDAPPDNAALDAEIVAREQAQKPARHAKTNKALYQTD